MAGQVLPYEFEFDEGVTETQERILRDVLPSMVTMGYTLVAQGNGTYTFTQKYRPTWAIVLAVIGFFFFFLGLLFLLVKDTETVLITVTGQGRSSRVVVTGARKPWIGQTVEKRLREDPSALQASAPPAPPAPPT